MPRDVAVIAVGVRLYEMSRRTKREAADGLVDCLLQVLRLASSESTEEADVGSRDHIVELSPGDVEQRIDQLAMRGRVEQRDRWTESFEHRSDLLEIRRNCASPSRRRSSERREDCDQLLVPLGATLCA